VDLFREVLSKDVQFFDSRKTGDIMSRLQTDVQKIQSALSDQLSTLIKNSLYCIITMGILFWVSWEMTLFTIAIMIPLMCFTPIYGGCIQKIQKQISDKTAKQTEITEESFSNIRTIKAFASEDVQTVMFSTRNDDVFNIQKRISNWYGFFGGFVGTFAWGSVTLLIYFASYLIESPNSKMTIGTFTSFQFFMFSFLLNFVGIASVLGSVLEVFGNAAALAEIFMYEPIIKIKGGEEVTPSSMEDGRITLQNIEFTYPTKSSIQVIKNIAITVEKNKTVAWSARPAAANLP